MHIVSSSAHLRSKPMGRITEFLKKSRRCRYSRERIVLALDTKGGRIVIKGWQEATTFTAEEVIEQLEPHCSGFLCTYVDKEGMMQGTDLDWFSRLRAATDMEITAAGGITTIDDIRALTAMKIHCALGMAIYTGRLDLAELAATPGILWPCYGSDNIAVIEYCKANALAVRAFVAIPVVRTERPKAHNPP